MLHPGSQSRDSDFPHGLNSLVAPMFSSPISVHWCTNCEILSPAGIKLSVCSPADCVHHNSECPAHHRVWGTLRAAELLGALPLTL